MKWTNKGHEYDEIGNIFSHSSRIYIYGDNYEGKNAYRLISFLKVPVVMVRSSANLMDDAGYGFTKTANLLKRGDVSSIVRQIRRRLGGGG